MPPSTLALVLLFCLGPHSSLALSSIRSSIFHGNAVAVADAPSSPPKSGRCFIDMRKQKASNKRTRRRQLGQDAAGLAVLSTPATFTASPMASRSWSLKQSESFGSSPMIAAAESSTSTVLPTGGRQRSRKRSTLYNALHFYHNTFLNELTAEYQAEVSVNRAHADKSLDYRERSRFPKPTLYCQ
jgi:hypothetical protein